MINYLVNKIGAVIKLSVNMYYDQKLAHDVSVLKKDIAPLYDWSTTVQSLDYLYIQKSLNKFDIREGDVILDLGSGKGRILLYLNYLYRQKEIKLLGVEISKEAFLISQKLLKDTDVSLFNTNAIEKNFIGRNNINKVIMFNPFNTIIFQKYIEYIIENIKYKFEFIYINISLEQLEVLKNLEVKYIRHNLNYPLLGINNKINVVGYLN